jgi:hypothetical protein
MHGRNKGINHAGVEKGRGGNIANRDWHRGTVLECGENFVVSTVALGDGEELSNANSTRKGKEVDLAVADRIQECENRCFIRGRGVTVQV